MNEISIGTVAPKALEMMAVISALVRFFFGSIVVFEVPTRSPLLTASVIASVDQSRGKSSKSLTFAANENVCISIITASKIAVKRVVFFMFVFLSLFPK